MKNVYVCDSRVTTFAEGALIVEIVKYIKSHPDAQPDEIILELERLKASVHLVAALGDLKYLKMGGRLGSASYVVASALKIKPIITLDGGKVSIVAKKVGEKANEFMVSLANKRNRNYPIYFGHSAEPKLIDDFLKKYAIALDVDPQTTPIHEIGCVVGTHAGPHCYGMVYFM